MNKMNDTMISKILSELHKDTKYKLVEWKKVFSLFKSHQVYKCLWNGEHITLKTHLNDPNFHFGYTGNLYINNVYITDDNSILELIKK